MNNENDLFPVGLKPSTFMREYERGKKLVDAGIRDYFILVDNAAFNSVREIGNTTLKDIREIFGAHYISAFRFAGKFNCGDEETNEDFQTLRIRPLSKSDKKKLRNDYRYFPSDCWTCEWKDAKGNYMLLPFIQKDDDSLLFLGDENQFRKIPINSGNIGKKVLLEETAPGRCLKKIIENLPDYFTCDFATVSYKHTQILIPLPKGTAKATFRNRDKDVDGVRRRIVHEVREHDRVTLKKAPNVKSHMRGTGEITINGIDVTIISSFELSEKYLPRILEHRDQAEKNLDKAFVITGGK